jgi:hypothetical protein
MTTIIKTKPGKQNTVDRAEGLSAGTQKHFTNASQQLSFGNATHTVQEVTTNLNEIATLRSDTVDAQTNAKAKVAAEKARLPALRAFMKVYIAFVRATFGDAPEVLADFGLTPKKAPKPRTGAQLAAAKAKRDATRKARGTVGPVKKQAIIGDVVGVEVTPITAPKAPASPTPATATAASTPSTGAPGASSGGSPAPHS